MTQTSDVAETLALVESSVTTFLNQTGSQAHSEAGAAALWREVVEMGLTNVALPETGGGSGLGAAGFVCVARQFGRAAILPPYIACGVAPAAALDALDDGHFSCALLQLLSDAAVQVAFGSRPQGEPARLNGKGITGQWALVPYRATHLLVVAEESLCLVSLEQPAVAREVTRALDGSMVAAIGLSTAETLHIEASPRAGRAMLTAEASSKLGHAALLHGLSESAFGQTQAYIKTRVQFEQPISAFQSIQHRSVDQYMAIALTAASIDAATVAYDADPTAPATSGLIAAALARAATTAAHVARESVQMHGAIGFTAEADIGRYVRAIVGMTNQYGTARENRRHFARMEGVSG